eukprot:8645608-Pyramimonas_sp.AAC.2
MSVHLLDVTAYARVCTVWGRTLIHAVRALTYHTCIAPLPSVWLRAIFVSCQAMHKDRFASYHKYEITATFRKDAVKVTCPTTGQTVWDQLVSRANRE